MIETQAMGGTESTVLRIAKGLADRGINVVISQHNRKMSTRIDNIEYTPILRLPFKPTVVVTLRSPLLYEQTLKLYPHSKHYLWMHDLPQINLGSQLVNNTSIISVSSYHTHVLYDTILKSSNMPKNIKINHIYNPISDSLVPQNSTYSPYKLVFFSSPHKGLEQTLTAFKRLRAQDPKFELFIGNPGYLKNEAIAIDGVHELGALPQHEIHKHVSEALCVFYVNSVFPETFGLVFAEANALGTPVITFGIGAAREVLENPNQISTNISIEDVLYKVHRWVRGERPTVTAKPEFKLSNVIKSWLRLFK